MIRNFLITALVVWLSAFAGAADTNGAAARIDAAGSELHIGWTGKTTLTLMLSRGVPYRVFTMDTPRRLVIDFRDLDLSNLQTVDLEDENSVLRNVRFGAFRPGWSRLVADLAEPVLPSDVGLQIAPETGRAQMEMTFDAVSDAEFKARAGVPDNVLWPSGERALTTASGRGDFVVVIDPGHGGIDPGAERDGVSEKELMLHIALELQAVLTGAGAEVILTRENDVFVSLESRVASAHQAGADVFLSLHADALTEGGAQGATVYALSDEASDKATAHLAARHNRTDLIAGADLTGSDDEITGILLDLARQETAPRTESLAKMLVRGMTEAGGPMNNRPLRKAGFSVLKSADIPSVLIEVGFLSSTRDLSNLRRPEWRSGMVNGIARALLDWRKEDAARRALLRR